MTSSDSNNRPLTDRGYRLVRWMLEHGTPEAATYLPQLERASVTPDRCPCGCASINFEIEGQSTPAPGVTPIADFLFGEGNEVSGVFVFARPNGVLGGVEVYACAGEAPASLPDPERLRPL